VPQGGPVFTAGLPTAVPVSTVSISTVLEAAPEYPGDLVRYLLPRAARRRLTTHAPKTFASGFGHGEALEYADEELALLAPVGFTLEKGQHLIAGLQQAFAHLLGCFPLIGDPVWAEFSLKTQAVRRETINLP
jgi:hypothetical protein